jgi:hypothetical protein
MTALRTDPSALRRFAESRWAGFAEGRPLAADQIRAMTEAMFRVAVHPDCARTDAVGLLFRAYQAEPGDVRFAYHLGRMALEDDSLADAVAWLDMAHTTAPGDHRVAAHLILALRGLEREQPTEAAEIRATHRSRARELATAVHAAGVAGCGWPGFYDLEVDAVARLEVTDRVMDEFRAALTALRDLADRPGGVRAFAVAAVCWLIRGYPVRDVCDLADGLPAGDHRATYLLHLVCDLFAMPEPQLPRRLATALASGELPGTVVALIHQRRLLHAVRPFPELGALLAARWSLDDKPSHGAPTVHVSKLDDAVDAMRARPPALGGGPGANGEKAAASEALDRLTELETILTVLAEERRALVAFVTGPLKAADRKAATDEECATVAADHAVAVAALDRQVEAAGRAHERAELLTGEVGHLSPDELGEDFNDRADAVRVGLADLKSPGKMRRLLGKIKKAGAGRPGTPASQAATAFNPLSQEESAPTSAAIPVNPSDVPAALARAHAAVAEIFAEAERSLESYPASGARWHLRGLVLGRLAENQYRMGQAREARRTWHRLLADNGPNAPAYRNLAVAALCDGDERHSTEMWRRYLAELYAEAAAVRNLGRRAAEREKIHGAFAAAYLPPSLRGDEPEAGAVVTVRFLASERAVRAAVAHLRLRALNAVLDEGGTPPEDPLLPEPFRLLIAGTPPRPVTQEGRRRAVVPVVQLKQRVERSLFGADRWALSSTAITVVGNLRLLDQLPLDPDDGDTYRAALSLGITDPTERLAELGKLSERAVAFAVTGILRDTGRQKDADLYKRYNNLLKAWVAAGVPPESTFRLDAARSLYDVRTSAAIAAAENRGDGSSPDVVGAQQALHKLWRRIPAATGPARDLALLNRKSDDFEGAWRVLYRALREGVHPIGLRLTAQDAVAVGWKLRRYSGLTQVATLAVEGLAQDESMWEMLENVYLAVATDLRARRYPTSGVTVDFRRWLRETTARRDPDFRRKAEKILHRLEDEGF